MNVEKVRLVSILLIVIFISACSSKSMVRTNPPGGKVYQVDTDTGRELYLGTEPVQIEGRAFKSYYLRAEKDEYEGVVTVKAQQMDAGRAALGCLACGVPGLLGAGLVLPDMITIQMYKDSRSAEEQIIELETDDNDSKTQTLQ